MDYSLFPGFVLTSVAIILVPGPNVLVIVSTSLTHGMRRGLQTVLGTSSAMLIQLVVTAFATSWLVTLIADGLEWLRWLGVAYLIYLGVTYLLNTIRKEDIEEPGVSAQGTYIRGFIVSLTNPKTILFFSAFLPQFVSQSGDYTEQILLLSVTFLFLAMLLDGMYAMLSGRISRLIQGQRVQKAHKGISGLLYLGAGAWLAAMKKI